MSQKKFGPDRFSRFDVYWTQTNRQTNRQAKFIYRIFFIIILDLICTQIKSDRDICHTSIIKFQADFASLQL